MNARAPRQKKPFTLQLGLFYRAPLSGMPLLVAVAGALADAWLASGAIGAIDRLLMVVVTGVELRYALSLLRRFSLGYFDLSAHVAEEDEHPYTVYKVLFGLFVMSVIGGLLSMAMPALGWVFMVLMVVVTPALVMRTTAHNSLGAGLSVPGWREVIGVMRGGYGWLLGMCLLVLLGSGLTAEGLARLGGGGLLSQAITAAVSYYALFVAFCMMGYGLFEHSERLGIETRYEQAERWSPRGRSSPTASDSAQELLAQGDVEAAFEVAREEARVAPEDAKVQERYFKLLQMRGDNDKLLVQAARWLKACADAQRTQDTAALVERWWMQEQTMLDDWPESFLRAARLASKAGLVQEPLRMAGHFRKVYVGSMLMPQMLLFEAEHRLSRLRDAAGAKATLLDLMQRYTRHDDEVAQARVMLNVIEAVERGPAGAAPAG